MVGVVSLRDLATRWEEPDLKVVEVEALESVSVA